MDIQPNSPKRVEELWFEDGNIVLQAGDSQFRVYRGILAVRSHVFQDMLSFPQPPDSDLVDGCPLVHLPDSEIEVCFFLKAIFDPEFLMPFPSKTTFDAVTSCLRLSHKYGVDFLRRRALIHLSSGYDTKLSRWDVADTFGGGNQAVDDIMSWPWPQNPANEIYAIPLYREVGALWLLPSTFYNMSACFPRIGQAIFHGATNNGVLSKLSAEDGAAFVKGSIIQTESTTTEILKFLSDPLHINGCSSPTECALKRFKAIGETRLSITYCNPLAAWSNWHLLDGVCSVCLAKLRQEHQAARQAFWDKLPGIYGLPPWEELEEMKAAAIGRGLFS
ncbi:hypothetical protein C8F04DRAFT_1135592 [Mycena alexandri]|uniref:BTB domain-containing protein n=1 Tax=Mycena alexandri TaxID=1745969 RepID=A0AAD6WVV4_9AGAR|nr:hypothetical protein C8F04DRAFT_1135592 [Mycena alexandri]